MAGLQPGRAAGGEIVSGAWWGQNIIVLCGHRVLSSPPLHCVLRTLGSKGWEAFEGCVCEHVWPFGLTALRGADSSECFHFTP